MLIPLHAYIIGHYKPSVRTTDIVSHTTYAAIGKGYLVHNNVCSACVGAGVGY